MRICIHEDFIEFALSAANTSTSNCSMTSKTSLRPSMKELTATRSMRLVVAWYSTCSTSAWSSELGLVDEDETTERCLWTRGESSGSTWRALRAVEARRGVGKGMRSCLLRGYDVLVSHDDGLRCLVSHDDGERCLVSRDDGGDGRWEMDNRQLIGRVTGGVRGN